MSAPPGSLSRDGSSYALTAFVDPSVEWTANEIFGVVNDAAGWAEELVLAQVDHPAEEPVDLELDVRCHTPVRDWCVVAWPEGFEPHAVPIARTISDHMDNLAVVATVVDARFWTWAVIDSGRLVDRFVSPVPRSNQLHERWMAAHEDLRGDPEAAGSRLAVRPEILTRYLVHDWDDDARAFPDDAHPLGDPRVVLDLWRRIGLPLPQPSQRPAAMLRFADTAPWPALPADWGF